MKLTALRIADQPDRWRALGFEVDDERVSIGGIVIELGGEGRGITGWAVDGLAEVVDGLPRFDTAQVGDAGAAPEGDAGTAPGGDAGTAPDGPASSHPNGAIGIDQVVVLTPDFDRTARALEQHELSLKRVRDAGGFRQGFRRLGPAILELVEARGGHPAAPAQFWGLVVIVPDLDRLKGQLGELLGTPTVAVQAGRKIATVRKGAGLTTRMAFMTPEP